MRDGKTGGVHWSFWVIGVVALIWNAMGGLNFIMQLDPSAVAARSETERTIIDGRPLWATAGFAIAVFGGAIGSILLMLRKSGAYHVFIASFVGVIVTITHTIGLRINFSFFELVLMVVMPFAVAAFLIWYSKWAQGRGWNS